MKENVKQALLWALGLGFLVTLPLGAVAQIAPLQQSASSQTQTQIAAGLLCYDFNRNLNSNSKGEAVRMLQYFLITGESASIDPAEFGTFGPTTLAAVIAFQQKYSSDILVHLVNQKPTGVVGLFTRAKLKALYGCGGQVTTPAINTPAAIAPSAVNLAVTNVTLDSNGVTATFCNNGSSDLPSAPFRIRLNGINRDFEVIGAQKAKSCDTETLPYSTWGLSYDPGTTFTAITLIDPNNIYRKGTIQFPSPNGDTITVPAVVGAHLSVRSVLIKSTGVQATFCNLGTVNLTSFPVKITVNGTAKNFDVPGAYSTGKCTPMSWTFDNWGLTYTPGTVYTVIVQVDPNNAILETNEFDNSATVVGMP